MTSCFDYELLYLKQYFIGHSPFPKILHPVTEKTQGFDMKITLLCNLSGFILQLSFSCICLFSSPSSSLFFHNSLMF